MPTRRHKRRWAIWRHEHGTRSRPTSWKLDRDYRNSRHGAQPKVGYKLEVHPASQNCSSYTDHRWNLGLTTSFEQWLGLRTTGHRCPTDCHSACNQSWSRRCSAIWRSDCELLGSWRHNTLQGSTYVKTKEVRLPIFSHVPNPRPLLFKVNIQKFTVLTNELGRVYSWHMNWSGNLHVDNKVIA